MGLNQFHLFKNLGRCYVTDCIWVALLTHITSKFSATLLNNHLGLSQCCNNHTIGIWKLISTQVIRDVRCVMECDSGWGIIKWYCESWLITTPSDQLNEWEQTQCWVWERSGENLQPNFKQLIRLIMCIFLSNYKYPKQTDNQLIMTSW